MTPDELSILERAQALEVKADQAEAKGNLQQARKIAHSLQQIAEGKTDPSEDSRGLSLFELRLLSLRALGYVKGSRGRSLKITAEGKAHLFGRIRMSALVRAQCLEVRADQAEVDDQLGLMRKLAEAAELAYYTWALECKGMAIRAKVYNEPTIEIVTAYECAYEALQSSYRCAQRASYYSHVDPLIGLETARIRGALYETLFGAV